MEFISKEWKPDHILATNEIFFKYEYGFSNPINFVVARSRQSSRIEAVEGFIQYSKEPPMDLFLAFWKASKGAGDTFLGINVLNYIIENVKFRSLSCCGINKETIPIYKYLGYQTGELEHFYILNCKFDTFKIAQVQDHHSPSYKSMNNPFSLEKFTNFESMRTRFDIKNFENRRPFKSSGYLEKRYFKHPIYNYDTYGFSNNGKVSSIIVTRTVSIYDRKALRIVDFLGRDEDWRCVGMALQELIQAGGYEYADFYQRGIDPDNLRDAGFVLRNNEDPNIIPNYFEPFIQKNIPLYYFTSEPSLFYIFKGDGDQDRPST